MKYYIVVNEWKYPTETGREIVGDFDLYVDALRTCRNAYRDEYDNYLKANNGKVYSQGIDYNNVDDELQPLGYYICSSPHEEENMFFRSIIIKREI